MQNKKINIGILAHVDAGKTTLSEAMLYITGTTRRLGRVDTRDAFLDNDEMERSRGITIFSKQAQLTYEDMEITLLDTPGHVDFSAETERTLQVLDYAVLVVSGADGVQGHTETLWRLLKRHEIPTFLFINKMDQDGTNKEKLLEQLQERLGEGCQEFTPGLMEIINEVRPGGAGSMTDTGAASDKDKKAMELLEGLRMYAKSREYPKEFGARVYKIARDENGTRLTYLKVTGGTLKVKDVLTDAAEKVNQIRIYSGAAFEAVPEVQAGTVCAVTGLTQTFPGEGIGAEPDSEIPVLEPVLTYRIILPENVHANVMLGKLKELEEEEPQLHIVWNENLREIQAQLMGEVQTEILQYLIKKRFGVWVEFGAGKIMYRETVSRAVEGVGHFEPLRHYAEVHLLLEPGEAGSGMVFHTKCSEDVLDRNWQRLILTHLEEREHVGVLTGAHITDMNITLTSGKAHLKHTEGGDFRQATYRAVRQGLMSARAQDAAVLLEPCYAYRLEVPTEMIGRAMSDVERMCGTMEPPEQEGEMSILQGIAPVATMQNYQKELQAYTSGRGKMSCSLSGYRPCHNAQEVITARNYQPEMDLENPTGSVFCAHGAGFVVSWDEVEEYMHMDNTLEHVMPKSHGSNIRLTEDELDEIYVQTILPKKKPESKAAKKVSFDKKKPKPVEVIYNPDKKPPLKEYLLVDGYNVIFAWDELKELAEISLDAARLKLQDILCNYQGFRQCHLIVVFDAYKIPGHVEEVEEYHNIQVVFTQEAETADQYIEKAAHEMGRKYHVTVATSDGTEQVIIRSKGCFLLSSRELKEEIARTNREIREAHIDNPQGKEKSSNYLFDHMPEELAEQMEEIRLGRKNMDQVKGNPSRQEKYGADE
ncbi:translation factor GTPase family protein [Hespellia stercorisuis]|uniref:Small GTP-binding protein domain-containing protein n=1 Tax=Hespellia stercorisuis DSM 15480 TaxID=1121950 RepID=A0A1M6MER0_9FIRM|nr:TetM/TetW/TetO/TetS family tetracycline resistance ribosomal protection protein [Hespellia stercorisuis]SHJ81944.1 small GTP-binding protein domain-containing protein [Hespellia stercorisuis DSM 15480]